VACVSGKAEPAHRIFHRALPGRESGVFTPCILPEGQAHSFEVFFFLAFKNSVQTAVLFLSFKSANFRVFNS